MSITETVDDAFTRVEAHIKNLFETGSPHQMPHAKDLAEVLTAAKVGAGVDTVPAAQLKIAQDNLTVEMAKTDAANAQVASLTTELAAANAKLAAPGPAPIFVPNAQVEEKAQVEAAVAPSQPS